MKLRKYLMLYAPEDQADLVARAIVVDGRGKKSGLSVSIVKELLTNPRMRSEMKEYGEVILKGARTHMMQVVYSAENFTTSRRLLRLSYRKLEWMRRLLYRSCKDVHKMHPDYETAVPAFPSVPEMKADEAGILAVHGGIVQQDDGRGAICEDLDRTICRAIARAHRAGELVSTGAGTDGHVFMWAGDGFMARKKSKWVQVRVILCSTTVLNQSPSDSQYVMSFAGGEDYDVLNIRLEDMRPVLQRLARDGEVKDEYGELPAGIGRGVRFALGGDKPWIMTVLGRRNMNHTHFSASCKCTRENIPCLDCEGGQDGHYSVDAEQMCRDSHVCPNMWLRGGDFAPFACGCCPKRFDSLADVQAEEDEMLAKDPGGFSAWSGRFSLSHGGRFWNSGPLFPFTWVWSDPLHLFLNLFNVAFDEGIDFFLQHEFVTTENKALIAQCDSIARGINTLLAQAHITARFGTAERKAFCGNDLRALIEHPYVLPDILSLVRPLYARMEPCSFAADASKARKVKATAVERLAREEEKGVEKGGGKQKARRVDEDDFNATAGISKAAAARVRKQQAALQAASEKSQTFDAQFDAHVLAIQQAVDGNYSWCVVNMLSALVEFYEFVHGKQWLADALAADANSQGGGGVRG
jgi:hypothetical protein